MKKTIIILALCTCGLSSFSASAYEKGDMLLRLGLGIVAPQAESDPLAITDPPLGSLDPILGTETGLGVDDS